MAYASVTYTSASGTTFALTNSSGDPIPYLRQSDISVTVNNVLKTLTTDYTFNTAGTSIVLNTAVSGVTVTIARVTDIADATVTYTAGSTLTAQDLNNADNQIRYGLQEFSDTYGALTTGTGDLSALAGFIGSAEAWTSDNAHTATTGAIDNRVDSKISTNNATVVLRDGSQAMQAALSLGGFKVTNLATPTSNTDASTKAYTDAQIDSALINDVIAGTGLTISDNTPTAGQITVGITNSGVGVTQIADGAVTSAKIADATIITGDLADGAVTSAKIADGTIVAGDLASDSVTTAKILNANVTTAKIADLNVTTAKIADLNVTTGKIADLGVATGKIADAAVTAAKIAGGSIDSTKLDGATVVTNSEHSGSTPNDTSFFTTSASDARYFRQDSSETISSGQAWSASDSYIATTAAIDARVIDLVDDVGGFVPIANENSFPVANPDINNPDGTGTIVSIAVMSTSRTPSSGTVTIANGSGSNTVTITGCGSTVLASGFGVLVETTSTLHTYTFHRLTPKATEVTTVASISADVTTVAGNNANVTAVAGNAANITTVAGSISNVNAVGGSISNVNSVASNLASVNSFANTYRIAASDPATSLDVGDLVFNTTASELRVYNGSVWQGGVTATGNLVSRSGDTMTGALGITAGTAGAPSLYFAGDTNTGIYSPGADQVAIASGGTGRLFIDSSGRLLAGTSTARSNFFGTTLSSVAQIEGTGSAGGRGALSVINNDVSNNPPYVLLGRSGAATLGSNAVVVSGSRLGTLTFHGADGTSFIEAATVAGEVDGTPGTNDMPGRLVFSTTADGAASPTERLRIDSSGRVGVGTSVPGGLLEVKSADQNPNLYRLYNAYNAGASSWGVDFYRDTDSGNNLSVAEIKAVRTGGNASELKFGTSSTPGTVVERVRINSSGNVGIGNSSPAALLSVGQGTPSTYVDVLINGATTANYGPKISLQHGGSEIFEIANYGRVQGGTSTDILVETVGSNKLQLGTNRAVALTIDTSQRVGIGTTSPGALLTLAASVPELRFVDSDNSLYGTITAPGGDIYIDADKGNGAGGSIIRFAVDDSERARIDSSGRLLVGSTANNTGSLVQIRQDNNLTSTTVNVSTAGGLSVESVSGNANYGSGIWFDHGSLRAGIASSRLATGNWGTDLRFYTHPEATSNQFEVIERFRISSSGAQSSVIPGGSTLYPSFDCRAWVNFNGTGTVAIRGSGNVSSITDNGVGDYTVNFTTAMPDANYSPAINGTSSSSGGIAKLNSVATPLSTSSMRVQNTNAGQTVVQDNDYNFVAIFR
jgi:hypothetical protein